MKNLELMGVQEMDAKEMNEVDGGVLLLVIAVCLLLSSCTFINNSGNNVNISTSSSVDSTANGAANGNTLGNGSGNKVD